MILVTYWLSHWRTFKFLSDAQLDTWRKILWMFQLNPYSGLRQDLVTDRWRGPGVYRLTLHTFSSLEEVAPKKISWISLLQSNRIFVCPSVCSLISQKWFNQYSWTFVVSFPFIYNHRGKNLDPDSGSYVNPDKSVYLYVEFWGWVIILYHKQLYLW